MFYICLTHYTEHARIVLSSDQPDVDQSTMKIYTTHIRKVDGIISRDLKGVIASGVVVFGNS